MSFNTFGHMFSLHQLLAKAMGPKVLKDMGFE